MLKTIGKVANVAGWICVLACIILKLVTGSVPTVLAIPAALWILAFLAFWGGGIILWVMMLHKPAKTMAEKLKEKGNGNV